MTTRPVPFHESFRAESECWDWQSVLTFCRATAAGQTASRDLAEDAAQEAAIRAWRYRAGCHRPADPRPWLAVIVRREVHRLRSGMRIELPLDSVTEPMPGADDLDAVEERVALEAAVSELVIGDRRILLLRYARDMTQPQIARVLGVPEGTVKIRLHRARARLRSVLEQESRQA